MALPTVGSTAPPVRSAASHATESASKSSALTVTVTPALACSGLELRVGPEPAAGEIDGGELGGQQLLGLVGRTGVLHDDGGGGADGPEGARRRAPAP